MIKVKRKICLYCGNVYFKFRSGRRYFCSGNCQRLNYYKRLRQSGLRNVKVLERLCFGNNVYSIVSVSYTGNVVDTSFYYKS